jgi:hypothetical protein
MRETVMDACRLKVGTDNIVHLKLILNPLAGQRNDNNNIQKA